MSITLPYESGTFRAIEIDCPWQYKDRGYNGFETVQKYRIHCPYPTMSLAELSAMGGEINRVANERCHLWLWTTKDFMEDALVLIRAWGWHYKQIVTWLKTTKDGRPTYGMGHWLRNGTEFLLLAVNTKRGNLPLKRTTTPNYLLAPRGRHSAKPEEAYRMIRANSEEPRLSLFQRTPREGFTCWGNELREVGV